MRMPRGSPDEATKLPGLERAFSFSAKNRLACGSLGGLCGCWEGCCSPFCGLLREGSVTPGLRAVPGGGTALRRKLSVCEVSRMICLSVGWHPQSPGALGKKTTSSLHTPS